MFLSWSADSSRPLWSVALAETVIAALVSVTLPASAESERAPPCESGKEAAPAEGSGSQKEAEASEPEKDGSPRTLEFSFGSAQLFHNQSVYDPGGIVRQKVIPVGAVAMFAEVLLPYDLSAVALLTWPLEPRAILRSESVQMEYVAPSLAAGLRYSPLSVEVLESNVLEGQLALLVGSTMGQDGGESVYPQGVLRLHLHDDRGFSLYAGLAFAFGVDVAALIYGVGHRF